MRGRTILAATALVLAGCGDPDRAALPDEVLFVATTGGLEQVDAATGATESSVPGGIPSPDYSVVVGTEPAGDATVVRVEARDGTELVRTSVAGDVSAAVVSADGHMVALTEGGHAATAPYVPEKRRRTRIVVVDGNGKDRDYVLDGNFAPEAFSTAGHELFMIEYVPALAPERYQVRRLKLGSGRVVPIGRKKNAAPDQMQGTGRTQVHAHDGSELYTLYTQQDDPGHAHAGEHPGGGHAFVHLLNLDDSWAHCIDLPHDFGTGESAASAVTLSPDGRHLYVVDWSGGNVAVVRPDRLKVERSVSVPFGARDDATFARAGERAIFVGGGTEVVVLDPSSLNVMDRWNAGAEVVGLTLGPDERHLFVSVRGEIIAFDTETGALAATIPTEQDATVTHAVASE